MTKQRAQVKHLTNLIVIIGLEAERVENAS